jgi:hypothetical protein
MKQLCVALFSFLIVSCTFAQPASIQRKKNPYKWMIGLSWNIVDDDGNAYSNLFDIPGSWNYEYFPSRLSVDRYLRRGWSIEGSAAFNRYTSPKLINDTTGRSGIFVCADFQVKYSFSRFLRRVKWLDPYMAMGLGGTYRTTQDPNFTPLVTTTFGANFWFTRKWGIQVQTAGKLALSLDFFKTDADYLQHSIGVVYRFDPKKKSSNRFSKSQHKWINEKQRYNRRNT